MLLTTLSAGCAHYAPAPIDARAQALVFRERSLEDPGLQAFVFANLEGADADGWPPPRWDFDTLTLTALYFHPSLVVARAEVEVANARRLTAGERPNPSLDAAATSNTSSTDLPSWILGAAVAFNLETAGKRGHRIAAARALAEAAHWQAASAAWEVRRRLREALLDLCAAGRTRQLIAKQVEQQQELVRLLEVKLELGAISATLLTRERIALRRQELDLQRAAEEAATARIRLADALGLTVQAIAGVSLSFDELEDAPDPLPGDQARLRAVLNRADLLASLAFYTAAEADLQLEIAKQYPNLQIGPGYELDQGDNKWTLALSLPLAILSWNQGPIAEARARRHEAAARFQELQTRVIAQVEQAVARFLATREQVAVTTDLVADLKHQEQLAVARKRVGEVGREVLVGARLELLAGQLAELEAEIRLQRTIGDLEDAMQSRMTMPAGLFTPDTVAPRDRKTR